MGRFTILDFHKYVSVLTLHRLDDLVTGLYNYSLLHKTCYNFMCVASFLFLNLLTPVVDLHLCP